MKKTLLLLFLLCCFCFVSCSNNGPDSEKKENFTEIDDYFSDFPSSPFLNINFNEPLKSLEEKLLQREFTQQQNQKEEWRSKDEGTTFLMDESENLSNFRVYFFDKNEAYFNDLSEKLSISAKKTQKATHSNQHTEMKFETLNNNFSLSLFWFEDQIRLHFKPTSWH